MESVGNIGISKSKEIAVMRELYHYPLDAYGRLARIYLKEKALDHETIIEKPWDRKKPFSEYHMFSDLPTLIDMDGIVLEGWYAIVEHMELLYRSNSLFGVTQKEKAETRRIITLFNMSFFSEVTQNIVFEKIVKRYTENASPDSTRIRKGMANISKYFDYIAWLTNRRNWLGGDSFTLADISAAAHISCVDYMGSIEWNKYPDVQDWYIRIKSRPSFREILTDRVSTVTPPDHYSKLDY